MSLSPALGDSGAVSRPLQWRSLRRRRRLIGGRTDSRGRRHLSRPSRSEQISAILRLFREHTHCDTEKLTHSAPHSRSHCLRLWRSFVCRGH